MAGNLRKFLFMNQTEGYAQEQSANDELSLGKITLGGVSGVALDVSGKLISNVGAPVGDNDAARKLDVTNAQVAAAAYTDTQVAAEATARQNADTQLSTDITAEATARANADTQLSADISAEATARQNADTALSADLTSEVNRAQAAEAAITTAYQAADTTERNARIAADSALSTDISNESTRAQGVEASLSSAISSEATRAQGAEASLSTAISNEATRAQSAEASITAAYQQAVTDEAAARVAGDAATLASAKSYADSLQNGFIVKAPAKAIAVSNITLSGEQTVDGVPLVAGDRVLVAGQSDATKNGIYVVAAGAWSRSQDANDDAEVKDGMSVFIEQGGVYADSTWVLITNNVIVLGTTDLTFIQFSGLGQVIAGDGLSKTGNRLDVNVGNGIAIMADAVAVNLNDNPGLRFIDGKLEAKPDGARALAKDASGLYVKVKSGAGVAIDAADGLTVPYNDQKGITIGSSGLEAVVDTTKGLKVDGSGIGIDLYSTVSGLYFPVDGKLAVKANTYKGIDVGINGVALIADKTRGLDTDGSGAFVVVNGSKAMAVDASGLAVKYDDQKAMAMDATKGLQVVADEQNAVHIDAAAGLQVKYDATKAMKMDASAGLQLRADETQGLHIDASAGLQATIAANSGLQFTGGKFDLKLKNDARLTKDASGLDVVGLPLNFTIDAISTLSSVTAANLGTLTSGANAQALHYHDSLKAPRVAVGSIAACKAVYVSGVGAVSAASCSSAATARVVGVSTGAAAGGSVVVQHAGMLGGFAGLTAGNPYYLGSDGSPVDFSALVSGDRVIRLGYAWGATTMEISIQDMGSKA